MTSLDRTTSTERVRLSALDPELAERLGPSLENVIVVAERLPAGPWSGVPPGTGLGVLVARGLLAHATRLGSHRSVVMAWEGDIVTPAGPVPAWVTGAMQWDVVEPAVIAHLDARFLAAVCPRPNALEAVVERVATVQARGVVSVALSQLPRVEDRLLGTLLVLADERGRVSTDGLLLPVFLTHERLGELIGAARPTVSLAFARLRQRGLVRSRNRHWVIRMDAAETLTGVDG